MKKIHELLNHPQISNILTTAIIVVMVIIFLKPAAGLLKEFTRLNSEMKKVREVISKSSTISTTFKTVNKEITTLNKDMAIAEKKFFSTSEDIFSTLNRFAQNSKISLNSINPSERVRKEIPNRKASHLELLPISINTTCDYQQLIKFLNRIEKSEKAISVIDIKVDTNPADIWNHKIDIRLNVYLLTKTG